MSLFGSTLRYGTVAQAFHWLTAVLVAAAWLTASREPARCTRASASRSSWWWRCASSGASSTAGRSHELSALSTLSSRVVHGLLYALLFAIPLSAIVGTWLQGHELTIYGMALASPLSETSRQLGHQILEVHQLMGTTIIWLAGAHAAAALFHHYFRKDGVLGRCCRALRA